MAANIKVIAADGTESNAARKDIFALHPFNIQRIDANNTRRPRSDGSPTVPMAEIIALAENMMEMGNQEPIKVRKLTELTDGPNGKCSAEVVFGFSRHRAAEWIALNHPDKVVMLKCILFDGNNDKARLEGISENRFRNKTTPLDDAFNQDWMRQNMQWNDTRIAQFYKMNPSQVSKLKSLLRLSSPLQDAISNREIEADGCYEMSDLPEEKQLEILTQLRSEHRGGAHYDVDQLGNATGVDFSYAQQSNPNPNRTGASTPATPVEVAAPEGTTLPTTTTPPVKIETASVKKAVRKAKHEAGLKGPALTLRDVKEFFANLDCVGEDLLLREFAKKFAGWVAGDLTEQQMLNAVYKVRDETAERLKGVKETVVTVEGKKGKKGKAA
jgi:hypothetical protein